MYSLDLYRNFKNITATVKCKYPTLSQLNILNVLLLLTLNPIKSHNISRFVLKTREENNPHGY